MSGLFAGTPLEQPVTCEACRRPLEACACPRDAAGRVCRPADQVARIRREKRRNGKVVTVIAGLDPVASDLKALAKQLRTDCGSGGSVTEAGIELQGDHRERAAAALRELGYPVKGG